MNGPVILDTNLLMLLVVGSTSRNYIAAHKRLAADFTSVHFDVMVELIGAFSDILLVPDIVAETSSLLRHIANPMRRSILSTFKELILGAVEVPVASMFGANRDEFHDLGATDAVILHVLSLKEVAATLMTIDQPLLHRAGALGYDVFDFRQFLD